MKFLDDHVILEERVFIEGQFYSVTGFNVIKLFDFNLLIIQAQNDSFAKSDQNSCIILLQVIVSSDYFDYKKTFAIC